MCTGLRRGPGDGVVDVLAGVGAVALLGGKGNQ